MLSSAMNSQISLISSAAAGERTNAALLSSACTAPLTQFTPKLRQVDRLAALQLSYALRDLPPHLFKLGCCTLVTLPQEPQALTDDLAGRCVQAGSDLCIHVLLKLIWQ